MISIRLRRLSCLMGLPPAPASAPPAPPYPRPPVRKPRPDRRSGSSHSALRPHSRPCAQPVTSPKREHRPRHPRPPRPAPRAKGRWRSPLRPFLALLHAIMAGPAQALPVAPIPEQFLVPPVRGDVIHQGRRGPAHRTARVKQKELGAGLLPFGRVTPLAGRRPPRIVAAVAGTGALHLALAPLPVRHYAATGTDMGRFRHCGGLSMSEAPRGQRPGQSPALRSLSGVRVCIRRQVRRSGFPHRA